MNWHFSSSAVCPVPDVFYLTDYGGKVIQNLYLVVLGMCVGKHVSRCAGAHVGMSISMYDACYFGLVCYTHLCIVYTHFVCVFL